MLKPSIFDNLNYIVLKMMKLITSLSSHGNKNIRIFGRSSVNKKIDMKYYLSTNSISNDIFTPTDQFISRHMGSQGIFCIMV